MPKVVDHEAQRTSLLEAGFDVFAGRGYAGVSMRQLASALGVSTGTLYHYFDGKKAFFEQMVRHVAARDVADGLAGLPAESTVDEVIEQTLAFVSERERHLQDFIALSLDYVRAEPDAKATVASAVRAFVGALDARLGPAGGAERIVSAMVGALVLGHLDDTGSTVRDAGSTLRALLVGSVHQ